MIRCRASTRDETSDLRSQRTTGVPERRLRAVIACSVAVIGVACHSYYPASASRGLRGDVTIDIQFVAPSAVTIATPAGDTLRQSYIEGLRGRVLMVHADTVTVQVAKLVTHASGTPIAFSPGTTTRVVLRPGDALSVKHVSAPKTTLLVGSVLAIVLFGAVAAAASTIQYSY